MYVLIHIPSRVSISFRLSIKQSPLSLLVLSYIPHVESIQPVPTQGFTQEEQEFQVAVGRREAKGSQVPQIDVEEGTATSATIVEQGVKAYVDALRRLLKSQTVCLIDHYGINPAIQPVVQSLWHAYITKHQILQPSFSQDIHTKLQHHVLRQRHAEGTGRRGAKLAPVLSTFATQKTIAETALTSSLPIGLTLSLLFLAAWHVRSPCASPLDLVTWALDGQLPYLDFGQRYKELLAPFSSVLYKESFLYPGGTPSPNVVYNRSIEIAADLKWECVGAINAGGWLERWAGELRIDDCSGGGRRDGGRGRLSSKNPSIVKTAKQLYNMYGYGRPEYSLQYHVAMHPWAQLMVFIVISAKFWYGLDGSNRSMATGDDGDGNSNYNNIDWFEWARETLIRLPPGFSSYPLTAEEAINLPDEAFNRYINHLKNHVFAGVEATDELKAYKDIFATFNGSSGDGGSGEREGAENGRDQLTTAPLDNNNNTTAYNNDNIIKYTERQLPILPVGTYTYFGRSAGGEIVPLSPQYVAVLTVAASRVWVTPRALHEAVAAVEREMITAETEVAYELYADSKKR
jgi:hypothetical protein